LWQCSDASLVLLKKSDLFKTVIPSKIFESLAMKKPILLGVEGEAKELVEASGGGLCIEPENAAELAARVAELADKPELCRTLGERGRAFVSEHFDRGVLAARYARVIEDVVAQPAAQAAAATQRTPGNG
jgi:glycosyltransferase involved in cell wall biosynthesis